MLTLRTVPDYEYTAKPIIQCVAKLPTGRSGTPRTVWWVFFIMKDKKSFIAYCDWIEVFEELPDETAGKLIKHLFAYVNDQNPETDEPMVKLAFIQIKQALKRDLMKYENYIEKQRTNGSKGGRPKNPEKPKKPNGLLENPTEPKKADSDSVNESDTKEGLKGEPEDSPYSSSSLKPPSNPTVKTFEDNYKAFITHFNHLKGLETGTEGKFQGDEKSKRQFKVLHKQHNSTDIVKAINAMFRDQHHIDTGFKYATPEFITRQDKFARFLENA